MKKAWFTFRVKVAKHEFNYKDADEAESQVKLQFPLEIADTIDVGKLMYSLMTAAVSEYKFKMEEQAAAEVEDAE